MMTSKINQESMAKMMTWIPGPRMILMFAQGRALLNRQRNQSQKNKNEKQSQKLKKMIYVMR